HVAADGSPSLFRMSAAFTPTQPYRRFPRCVTSSSGGRLRRQTFLSIDPCSRSHMSHEGDAPCFPFTHEGDAPCFPFTHEGDAPCFPFTHEGDAPCFPFTHEGDAPCFP